MGVVVTSVHIEKMKNNSNGDATTATASSNNLNDEESATVTSSTPTALILESVVSTTFSDMGLHNALERSSSMDGNTSASGGPNVASMLTKSISTSDILRVLIGAELATDETTVLTLSFTDFDGSINERGVTATETSIETTTSQNDGWPMFYAGAMITLVFVSIIGVGYYVYKKEFASEKDASSSVSDGGDNDKSHDNNNNNSVHYSGDLDLEVATTAASPGVLGLKGHHPQAATFDENVHPNNSRAYHRRNRRGLSSSSQMDNSTAFSSDQTTITSTSKHPLGIRSMGKVESFLTPQKTKSDRMTVYDIERLTRT